MSDQSAPSLTEQLTLVAGLVTAMKAKLDGTAGAGGRLAAATAVSYRRRAEAAPAVAAERAMMRPVLASRPEARPKSRA